MIFIQKKKQQQKHFTGERGQPFFLWTQHVLQHVHDTIKA